MCKIIRKIRDNKPKKLKRLYKSTKKVKQATYPGEKVQIDIKYVQENAYVLELMTRITIK
ncbi:hypothetical protein J5A73_02470 [Leptotrichia sp. oral taxon 218]|uniref:hypothetical protein n=1 Tax=Leptotrichia sp. oral taxon 218 TaxID=712361 RepID=UPI001B8D6240|nr:hypothetical protein [Leptotrichia sp. oral taxon 218]QUB95754.1 hypothetical protein J5A73_02470 [Leptotrichia sp. oral taxon 218]